MKGRGEKEVLENLGKKKGKYNKRREIHKTRDLERKRKRMGTRTRTKKKEE